MDLRGDSLEMWTFQDVRSQSRKAYRIQQLDEVICETGLSQYLQRLLVTLMAVHGV